jgi:hypothetical protein
MGQSAVINQSWDSSLSTVITREEAIHGWLECVLPFVTEQWEKDGEPDYIARSESFSDYADNLRENGDISEWQCFNWTHPVECGE